MTAKDEIIRCLALATKPLAIHEFDIVGHSQTSISARLREMQRCGAVVSRIRPGKSFKEWALVFKLELI